MAKTGGLDEFRSIAGKKTARSPEVELYRIACGTVEAHWKMAPKIEGLKTFSASKTYKLAGISFWEERLQPKMKPFLNSEDNAEMDRDLFSWVAMRLSRPTLICAVPCLATMTFIDKTKIILFSNVQSTICAPENS
jgi:hypothetical protein